MLSSSTLLQRFRFLFALLRNTVTLDMAMFLGPTSIYWNGHDGNIWGAKEERHLSALLLPILALGSCS